MALTRKLLKGMGLTDEQVETIIEAHTETTDGLKNQLSQYKADAEKLPGVQKELDDLKAAGDGGYKAKYEAEKSAHDAYKQQIAGEKQKAQDDKDIAAIIKEAGVERESFQRLILNSFDRQTLKRGADGAITNRAELVEAVKTQNPDCITTTETKGTPPANPPTGGSKGMTKEQIMAIKDPAAQRVAIAQNIGLFKPQN